MAIAVILTIVGCVFIFALCEERGMRRRARILNAREARQQYEIRLRSLLLPTAAGDTDLRAWTPQEREALGVNDTIALIDRIDKELGADYAEAKMTPAEHIHITREHISTERTWGVHPDGRLFPHDQQEAS